MLGPLRLPVPGDWVVAGPGTVEHRGSGLVLTVRALPDDAPVGFERALLDELPRADVLDRAAVVVAGHAGTRLLVDHATARGGCYTTELWWGGPVLVAATVPTLAYPQVQPDLRTAIAEADVA